MNNLLVRSIQFMVEVLPVIKHSHLQALTILQSSSDEYASVKLAAIDNDKTII